MDVPGPRSCCRLRLPLVCGGSVRPLLLVVMPPLMCPGSANALLGPVCEVPTLSSDVSVFERDR